MNTALKHAINFRRAFIASQLKSKLGELSKTVSRTWNDPAKLDGILLESHEQLSRCKVLYVVNEYSIQISANIYSGEIQPERRGQNLKKRPFMQELNPKLGFQLSSVYISRVDNQPCITAIQKIPPRSGPFKGYLIADFDLADLPDVNPEKKTNRNSASHWRQIKGDPAIRGQLFQQLRVTSPMDEKIQQVHNIVADLIRNRGIFHAKLHYSSSRATLWEYDKPHQYQIHVLDEIISPDVCLAYPAREYTDQARIKPEQIASILEKFAMLRNADETIYLRSASINIVNGMLGLTFSCDGSHYMPLKEFLGKPESFWFGSC